MGWIFKIKVSWKWFSNCEYKKINRKILKKKKKDIFIYSSYQEYYQINLESSEFTKN